MGKERHREFTSEVQYLANAIRSRESRRARLNDPNAANAGIDRHTQRVLRGILDKELREMQPPHAPAAFGRIDFRTGRTFYVGLEQVSDGSTDLVIDWRDDRARAWTEAESRNAKGLRLKRTFEYKKGSNELIDIRDELFEEVRKDLFETEPVPTATRGDADVAPPKARRTRPLRPAVSDVLLDELERTRTGAMGHIVRTMAAAQADLVRTDLNNLLIVQGGPGTGKTAILLHRISWLIYNYKIDDSDMLVVGPNRSFLRYIENVLPALGNMRIPQVDVRSMSEHAGLAVSSESQETERLKGSAVMVEVLERAVGQRVKPPESDLVWRAGGRRLVIPAADVARELRRSTGMPYMDRRIEFRSWLSARVVQEAQGGRSGFVTHERRALDRIIPALTPRRFLADFLGSKKRIAAAAGTLLDQAQLELLYRRSEGRVDEERWSVADLPLLDYVSGLIQSEPVRRYRHIVVDEAQDLSPMELRMIARRSAEGSMTIAGDIAQSTGSFTRRDWSDVAVHLCPKVPVIKRELKYGYRVPAQIFDLASVLLPHIAPDVSPPEALRSGPSDPEFLEGAEQSVARLASAAAKRHDKARLSVGVIAAAELYEDVAEALRDRGVALNEVAAGSIGPSVNLMTPELAKGLEFDAVVVVEPQSIADSSADGYRLLYIALTRATQHLTVVHSGPALPTPTSQIDDAARQLFELLRQRGPEHMWEPIIETLSVLARSGRRT